MNISRMMQMIWLKQWLKSDKNFNDKRLWEDKFETNLSACEVVNTFDSFTGCDSRKPSGVYGFKSVSMCQIAVRSIRQMEITAFLCPRVLLYVYNDL
mgnify:CR=1 FL=1